MLNEGAEAAAALVHDPGEAREILKPGFLGNAERWCGDQNDAMNAKHVADHVIRRLYAFRQADGCRIKLAAGNLFNELRRPAGNDAQRQLRKLAAQLVERRR